MNKVAEDPTYGLADMKGLLPSILAASVLGGLGTGYMTHRTPERPGEDPDERRKRVIRNGIAGAAMAGGATGLGQMAYRNISTGAPPISPFFANQLDPDLKGGSLNNILGGLATGTAVAAWPTKSRGYSMRWRSHKPKGSPRIANTAVRRLTSGGMAGLLGALFADPAISAYYHIGRSMQD